jgi:hypothetical protein
MVTAIRKMNASKDIQRIAHNEVTMALLRDTQRDTQRIRPDVELRKPQRKPQRKPLGIRWLLSGASWPMA